MWFSYKVCCFKTDIQDRALPLNAKTGSRLVMISLEHTSMSYCWNMKTSNPDAALYTCMLTVTWEGTRKDGPVTIYQYDTSACERVR